MAKDKKKKSIFRRFWFWAAVIVVIIIIAVSASSGGGGTTDDTASGSADNGTKQSTDKNAGDDGSSKKSDDVKKVGIGETATVSDVGFTVDKMEVKKKIKPENDFMEPAKASGQFVVLHVSIKNGQKEALTLMQDYFKIQTPDGTTYQADTDGDVISIIDPDKWLLLQQINPGIKKSGILIYDVPKDLNIDKAVLHCQTGFWGTETIDISLAK